jgi:hypothetical protein
MSEGFHHPLEDRVRNKILSLLILLVMPKRYQLLGVTWLLHWQLETKTKSQLIEHLSNFGPNVPLHLVFKLYPIVVFIILVLNF